MVDSIDDIRRLIQAHREAGEVKRMHCVPTLLNTSVSKHSWNMAILLYFLHPKPTLELIMRALTHDNAERWTGDVPAPMKYSINPEVGDAMKETEIELNKILRTNFDENMSEDDLNWSRGVDLLEFLMHCEDEVAMGNQAVRPSLENARHHIADNDFIPTRIKIFARDYIWERTRDVIDGEIFGKMETNE